MNDKPENLLNFALSLFPISSTLRYSGIDSVVEVFSVIVVYDRETMRFRRGVKKIPQRFCVQLKYEPRRSVQHPGVQPALSIAELFVLS